MSGADGTSGTDAVRVVVVDDHPIVRDGLSGILGTEEGIEVVGEAANGREAVAVVRANDPDVVLMDLRMPGGDGIDAIGALRTAHPTRPRILVLTTYDTDRDVRRAMTAGADGFLLKDARRAELVRAVHDVAAGRPVLTPAALAALAGRRYEAEPTDREVHVLRLVSEGLTNGAVARHLGIGEATVKTHLLHVYKKLGVGDRAAAVRVGWERGLI
ncbi:response regulator transcription factor [Nocardiopsis sp. CC223A]|uniref:response regulator n=1 Tax=Nocardiopsis sp. CC223A TaxID=3044051 RepID=UPI00278C83D7|nr:response regulator transcription factor [Nocardiopsis sp. CC223A]